MESLWHDLRLSLKALRKSPAFTAVSVLTLMLAVGANSAIFTLVNGVLLHPLPYANPERLMTIWNRTAQLGQMRVSEPELIDFSKGLHSFESMAAYTISDANLSGSDQPERVAVVKASACLLAMLGARPEAGRLLVPEEDQLGRDKVVMLSHDLWRRRFGGSREIVGRPILINGESRLVVGVAPRGFQFPDKAELWTPLGIAPSHLHIRGQRNMQLIGKLKPGVSVAQARAEAEVATRQIAETYHYNPESHWSIEIVPLREQQVAKVRSSLLLLQGAVLLVLLIACANVACLMLARAQSRRGEASLRLALGAGHGRLLRQHLLDGLALGLAGGVLGLFLAAAAVRLLLAANPDQLPRFAEVSLDRGVVLFTLVIALLTGLLVSLAAALTAMHTRMTDALAETGSRAGGGGGARRFRGVLVVCEVALAVVLLIGAGLLLKNFLRIEQIDPGFDPNHLLTVRLTLPDATYHEGSPANGLFYELLHGKLKAIPQVQEVGMAEHLPFGHTGVSGPFFPAPGSAADSTATEGPESNWNWVSPTYFQAMRMPLIRGRFFTSADRPGAERVVIIDDYLARAVYAGLDPVGRRIRLPGGPDNPWLRIVGVVGYVRQEGLDTESRGQLYLPHAQDPVVAMSLALRTAVDPSFLTPAVRQAVRSLDKDLPIYDAMPMTARIAGSLGQRRFAALLMASFAGLALVLAAVGIYSVMAYTVSQRNQELGIRLALGAQPGRLRSMVVGEGMRLVLIGLAAGLFAAFALSRSMQSMLYEMSSRDLSIFVAAPALLAAVALAANYLPARRASGTDPIRALRGT
jgi:putative ABC transport system permease protein